VSVTSSASTIAAIAYVHTQKGPPHLAEVLLYLELAEGLEPLICGYECDVPQVCGDWQLLRLHIALRL
jgi:hypothetical protein